MDRQASHSTLLSPLISLLTIIGLLLLELVLTMLVYTGLNIYSLDLFGTLVRFAGSVHAIMTSVIGLLLPGAANVAYATLFGEFAPKSILLLLIGLVVASIVRGIVGLISRRT